MIIEFLWFLCTSFLGRQGLDCIFVTTWVPWEFRHKEQVQAIFREWDTNCDGRLSIAEMARVLAEIGISQAWRVSCSTPAMPTADEIRETADVEC